MENLEMLTGTFPVAPDQLAQSSLKVARYRPQLPAILIMVPILNIYGNLKRS